MADFVSGNRGRDCLLLDAKKENERFLVNVSHELRTPINAVNGMSEEQLNQIFTHFHKGDSDVERKTGGLGLGLAIVHGMVAAMGGFISIKSKVSEGTHVHIVIPQQVVDKKISICVEKNCEFQIACYFNMEKYVRSEVGDYYCTMIEHIKSGLGLAIDQADSLDALKKMVAENSVTHVFVANWEYGMDQDYFDALSKKVYTVVFADDSFTLPQNSNVHVLRKPVYLLSVINYLNETMPGTFQNGRMADKEEKLYFFGLPDYLYGSYDARYERNCCHAENPGASEWTLYKNPDSCVDCECSEWGKGDVP